MDTTTALIMGGIITALTSIFSGIAIYRSNRRDDAVERNTQSITVLQQTAVTDSHVRTIIKEEMQPMNTALPEIVRSLNEFNKFMAEERGYRAGQQAAQRRLSDNLPPNPQ